MKILSKPKPKINLSKNEIKEVKKDFSKLRYGFSKSKINESRRSLYYTKNQKNLSASEIKERKKFSWMWKKIFLVLRSIMIVMISNTEE